MNCYRVALELKASFNLTSTDSLWFLFSLLQGAELPAADQQRQRQAELHGADWREALHADRVGDPTAVRVT